MAMVAPGAATTSIFRKGRKFIFMVFTPGEVYLEGFIELAARQGLRTVALLHDESVAMNAIAQGAADLAKKRGLQVVLFEGYVGPLRRDHPGGYADGDRVRLAYREEGAHLAICDAAR